jgi:hypothetical protein
VEETGVPGENHDLSQVTDKLYHIMLLKMGAFVLAVLAPSNQLVNMFAEKGLLKVQSIVIFQ